MSEPIQSEKAIVDAARRLPPEQRDDYLSKNCGGDSPLRRRVESLLAAGQSGSAGPSGTVMIDDDATVGADQLTKGALNPDLPSEEALGTVIGRYKLVEKLGEGGFGLVYVAEQTDPVKRLVALKIIKLGMDTRQVVARFEAERQALALMDHPNIAKVLDAGATEAGRPFFVMELVRGTKITEDRDRNKLPTRQRLDLFICVCRAIEHAHQKGIIHRDIKPSNILVTLQDGTAVPKVIDFGIAKATQGNLSDKMAFTQMDQFIGTPAYMSPEQAEAGGMDIDTRSDIYSLGVLLYELLTGETPLESKNLLERGFEEMRRLIREWEPQRPSIVLHKQRADEQTTTAKRHSTDAPKLIKMVRGDLDWVVMKCLEKDRTRRYDSAAELTAEIQRFLADEPVMARPPSKFYRFQKLVTRNRLAFAAGTAIFALLVAGLCVASWFVVKEKQERDAAEMALKNSDHARKIAEEALLQADSARQQTVVARRHSETAREESEEEHAKAVAAEKRADAAEKDAAASRQRAEAALQQSREDRDKASLAEKAEKEARAQEQKAQQLTEVAESQALAATAKREEAIKTAASEMALRKTAEAARDQAQTALQQAIAARHQVEAEAVKYAQGASAIWTSILPERLASLPPSVALKASQALYPSNQAGQPLSASVLRQRGEWLARMANWKEALTNFSMALQLDGSNLESLEARLPLLAQTGDSNAFIGECLKMALIHGGADDPAVARIALKNYLLTPWPRLDSNTVAASGSRAGLATNDGDGLVLLALAAYRQARYAEAADWAGKALAASQDKPGCQTQACAVLALAQESLKQTENARITLARGQQILTSKLPKLDGGDLGPDWPQWIMANTLMREGDALTGSPRGR